MFLHINPVWEQFGRVLANKSLLTISLFVGASNFIITELLTENKGFAIALSAFSTMAIAYFTSRPKVIAAQAAREATRHVNAENSNQAIIERLHYEIERKTVEISLIRISKHNALDALQAAYWHMDEVHDLCAEHDVSVPLLKKISVKEIFGEEDEQLRKMIADRLGE